MDILATLGVDIETAKAKAAIAQFRKMEKSAEVMEGKFRRLGKEVTVLEGKFGRLNKTLPAVRDRMKSIATHAKTVTTAVNAMGVAAGRSSTKVGTLGVQANSAKRKIQDLGSKTAATGNRVTALGSKAAGAGNRIDALGAKAAAAEARLRGLSAASATAGRGMVVAGGRARQTATAVQSIGRSSRRAKNDFADFAKTSTSHAEGFMGVVLRLTAIFGGLRLAMMGIQTISSFEDIRDSFTSLNDGNRFAGDRMFEFVREYARTSPQTFEEVASAVVGLKNNQIEPTVELLRLFSDVASVTSDQRGAFAQAVKLWQRGQQGGLGVEELDILSNRGVDVYGAIFRQTGLTRRHVGDMGQDAEGAKRIIAGLAEEWERLYGGASLRRIDNLSVKWNAFLDTTKQIAEEVGKGLGRTLHDNLDKTTTFLNQNLASFNALGVGIGAVVNRLGDFLRISVAINNALGNIPFAMLGGLMALMTGSGIVKVLRMLSPIGFATRSAATIVHGVGSARAGLKTGRELAAEYGAMGLVGMATGREIVSSIAHKRHFSALFDVQRQAEKHKMNKSLAYARAAADAQGDPLFTRSFMKNSAMVHNLGMHLGRISMALAPLAAAATSAGALGAAIATIGAAKTGAAILATSSSIDDVNAILKKANFESATFGDIWRVNTKQIGEDFVAAMEAAGEAIDKTSNRVPSKLFRWLSSVGKDAVDPFTQIGQSYDNIQPNQWVTGTGEIRTYSPAAMASRRAAAMRDAIDRMTYLTMEAQSDPMNPLHFQHGPRGRPKRGTGELAANYERSLAFYEAKQRHEQSLIAKRISERMKETGFEGSVEEWVSRLTSSDIAHRWWQANTRVLANIDGDENTFLSGVAARKWWQANTRVLASEDGIENTFEAKVLARKWWQANTRVLASIDSNENTFEAKVLARKWWQANTRMFASIDSEENTFEGKVLARKWWQSNTRVLANIDSSENTFLSKVAARKWWQANARVLASIDSEENTFERSVLARKRWQGNARDRASIDSEINTFELGVMARKRWQAMARTQASIDLSNAEARRLSGDYSAYGEYQFLRGQTPKHPTTIFDDTVSDRWNTAVNEFVLGKDRAVIAMKDLVKGLGNDLEARVLEETIGKPFRQLMTTILNQVYEAIMMTSNFKRNMAANGGGVVGFFSALFGGGGGGGTSINTGSSAGVSVVNANNLPSFSGGGFTGMGPRLGGIDGRGGFLAINHPRESVIDHAGGRGIVVQPVINIQNNADVDVTAAPSSDGEGIDIKIEKIVANAVANGGPLDKQMKLNYGLQRQGM